ncbi:MAG: hypothetical protein J7452_04470 [Thermoflexus sp.]|jgi:hypothetical protein|nr:hypothetical protein [Thermoflexus sp.]
MNPWRWILAGVFMMLLGWTLAFLMVLRTLPASFALAFLSFIASTAGFLIGMVGILLAQRAGPRQ